MKKSEEKTDVGRSRNITKVQGVASPELMLEKDDILVVYGSNKDIQAFLKS
jgi:trk system potassium uptake protein